MIQPKDEFIPAGDEFQEPGNFKTNNMNNDIQHTDKDFGVIKKSRVVYTGDPVALFTNDKEYDLDVMPCDGVYNGEPYEAQDGFIQSDDNGRRHWVTKDWYPKNFKILTD